MRWFKLCGYLKNDSYGVNPYSKLQEQGEKSLCFPINIFYRIRLLRPFKESNSITYLK